MTTTGGLAEAPHTGAPPPSGTDEHRFTIRDRGTVTCAASIDDDVTWTFDAIADQPPTIALAKEPEPQARGSLQLSYKIEDDYGVVSAQAKFARKETPVPAARRRARSTARRISRWSLPQARTRNGVGQTTKDLTEHPWAGAEGDDADRA